MKQRWLNYQLRLNGSPALLLQPSARNTVTSIRLLLRHCKLLGLEAVTVVLIAAELQLNLVSCAQMDLKQMWRTETWSALYGSGWGLFQAANRNRRGVLKGALKRRACTQTDRFRQNEVPLMPTSYLQTRRKVSQMYFSLQTWRLRHFTQWVYFFTADLRNTFLLLIELFSLSPSGINRYMELPHE